MTEQELKTKLAIAVKGLENAKTHLELACGPMASQSTLYSIITKSLNKLNEIEDQ